MKPSLVSRKRTSSARRYSNGGHGVIKKVTFSIPEEYRTVETDDPPTAVCDSTGSSAVCTDNEMPLTNHSARRKARKTIPEVMKASVATKKTDVISVKASVSKRRSSGAKKTSRNINHSGKHDVLSTETVVGVVVEEPNKSVICSESFVETNSAPVHKPTTEASGDKSLTSKSAGKSAGTNTLVYPAGTLSGRKTIKDEKRIITEVSNLSSTKKSVGSKRTAKTSMVVKNTINIAGKIKKVLRRSNTHEKYHVTEKICTRARKINLTGNAGDTSAVNLAEKRAKVTKATANMEICTQTETGEFFPVDRSTVSHREENQCGDALLEKNKCSTVDQAICQITMKAILENSNALPSSSSDSGNRNLTEDILAAGDSAVLESEQDDNTQTMFDGIRTGRTAFKTSVKVDSSVEKMSGVSLAEKVNITTSNSVFSENAGDGICLPSTILESTGVNYGYQNRMVKHARKKQSTMLLTPSTASSASRVSSSTMGMKLVWVVLDDIRNTDTSAKSSCPIDIARVSSPKTNFSEDVCSKYASVSRSRLSSVSPTKRCRSLETVRSSRSPPDSRQRRSRSAGLQESVDDRHPLNGIESKDGFVCFGSPADDSENRVNLPSSPNLANNRDDIQPGAHRRISETPLLPADLLSKLKSSFAPDDPASGRSVDFGVVKDQNRPSTLKRRVSRRSLRSCCAKYIDPLGSVLSGCATVDVADSRIIVDSNDMCSQKGIKTKESHLSVTESVGNSVGNINVSASDQLETNRINEGTSSHTYSDVSDCHHRSSVDSSFSGSCRVVASTVGSSIEPLSIGVNREKNLRSPGTRRSSRSRAGITPDNDVEVRESSSADVEGVGASTSVPGCSTSSVETAGCTTQHRSSKYDSTRCSSDTVAAAGAGCDVYYAKHPTVDLHEAPAELIYEKLLTSVLESEAGGSAKSVIVPGSPIATEVLTASSRNLKTKRSIVPCHRGKRRFSGSDSVRHTDGAVLDIFKTVKDADIAIADPSHVKNPTSPVAGDETFIKPIDNPPTTLSNCVITGENSLMVVHQISPSVVEDIKALSSNVERTNVPARRGNRRSSRSCSFRSDADMGSGHISPVGVAAIVSSDPQTESTTSITPTASEYLGISQNIKIDYAAVTESNIISSGSAAGSSLRHRSVSVERLPPVLRANDRRRSSKRVSVREDVSVEGRCLVFYSAPVLTPYTRAENSVVEPDISSSDISTSAIHHGHDAIEIPDSTPVVEDIITTPKSDIDIPGDYRISSRDRDRKRKKSPVRRGSRRSSRSSSVRCTGDLEAVRSNGVEDVADIPVYTRNIITTTLSSVPVQEKSVNVGSSVDFALHSGTSAYDGMIPISSHCPGNFDVSSTVSDVRAGKGDCVDVHAQQQLLMLGKLTKGRTDCIDNPAANTLESSDDDFEGFTICRIRRSKHPIRHRNGPSLESTISSKPIGVSANVSVAPESHSNVSAGSTFTPESHSNVSAGSIVAPEDWAACEGIAAATDRCINSTSSCVEIEVTSGTSVASHTAVVVSGSGYHKSDDSATTRANSCALVIPMESSGSTKGDGKPSTSFSRAAVGQVQRRSSRNRRTSHGEGVSVEARLEHRAFGVISGHIDFEKVLESEMQIPVPTVEPLIGTPSAGKAIVAISANDVAAASYCHSGRLPTSSEFCNPVVVLKQLAGDKQKDVVDKADPRFMLQSDSDDASVEAISDSDCIASAESLRAGYPSEGGISSRCGVPKDIGHRNDSYVRKGSCRSSRSTSLGERARVISERNSELPCLIRASTTDTNAHTKNNPIYCDSISVPGSATDSQYAARVQSVSVTAADPAETDYIRFPVQKQAVRPENSATLPEVGGSASVNGFVTQDQNNGNNDAGDVAVTPSCNPALSINICAKPKRRSSRSCGARFVRDAKLVDSVVVLKPVDGACQIRSVVSTDNSSFRDVTIASKSTVVTHGNCAWSVEERKDIPSGNDEPSTLNNVISVSKESVNVNIECDNEEASSTVEHSCATHVSIVKQKLTGRRGNGTTNGGDLPTVYGSEELSHIDISCASKLGLPVENECSTSSVVIPNKCDSAKVMSDVESGCDHSSRTENVAAASTPVDPVNFDSVVRGNSDVPASVHSGEASDSSGDSENYKGRDCISRDFKLRRLMDPCAKPGDNRLNVRGRRGHRRNSFSRAGSESKIQATESTGSIAMEVNSAARKPTVITGNVNISAPCNHSNNTSPPDHASVSEDGITAGTDPARSIRAVKKTDIGHSGGPPSSSAGVQRRTLRNMSATGASQIHLTSRNHQTVVPESKLAGPSSQSSHRRTVTTSTVAHSILVPDGISMSSISNSANGQKSTYVFQPSQLINSLESDDELEQFLGFTSPPVRKVMPSLNMDDVSELLPNTSIETLCATFGLTDWQALLLMFSSGDVLCTPPVGGHLSTVSRDYSMQYGSAASHIAKSSQLKPTAVTEEVAAGDFASIDTGLLKRSVTDNTSTVGARKRGRPKHPATGLSPGEKKHPLNKEQRKIDPIVSNTIASKRNNAQLDGSSEVHSGKNKNISSPDKLLSSAKSPNAGDYEQPKKAEAVKVYHIDLQKKSAFEGFQPPVAKKDMVVITEYLEALEKSSSSSVASSDQLPDLLTESLSVTRQQSQSFSSEVSKKGTNSFDVVASEGKYISSMNILETKQQRTDAKIAPRETSLKHKDNTEIVSCDSTGDAVTIDGNISKHQKETRMDSSLYALKFDSIRSKKATSRTETNDTMKAPNIRDKSATESKKLLTKRLHVVLKRCDDVFPLRSEKLIGAPRVDPLAKEKHVAVGRVDMVQRAVPVGLVPENKTDAVMSKVVADEIDGKPLDICKSVSTKSEYSRRQRRTGIQKNVLSKDVRTHNNVGKNMYSPKHYSKSTSKAVKSDNKEGIVKPTESCKTVESPTKQYRQTSVESKSSGVWSKRINDEGKISSGEACVPKSTALQNKHMESEQSKSSIHCVSKHSSSDGSRRGETPQEEAGPSQNGSDSSQERHHSGHGSHKSKVLNRLDTKQTESSKVQPRMLPSESTNGSSVDVTIKVVSSECHQRSTGNTPTINTEDTVNSFQVKTDVVSKEPCDGLKKGIKLGRSSIHLIACTRETSKRLEDIQDSSMSNAKTGGRQCWLKEAAKVAPRNDIRRMDSVKESAGSNSHSLKTERIDSLKVKSDPARRDKKPLINSFETEMLKWDHIRKEKKRTKEDRKDCNVRRSFSTPSHFKRSPVALKRSLHAPEPVTNRIEGKCMVDESLTPAARLPYQTGKPAVLVRSKPSPLGTRFASTSVKREAPGTPVDEPESKRPRQERHDAFSPTYGQPSSTVMKSGHTGPMFAGSHNTPPAHWTASRVYHDEKTPEFPDIIQSSLSEQQRSRLAMAMGIPSSVIFGGDNNSGASSPADFLAASPGLIKPSTGVQQSGGRRVSAAEDSVDEQSTLQQVVSPVLAALECTNKRLMTLNWVTESASSINRTAVRKPASVVTQEPAAGVVSFKSLPAVAGPVAAVLRPEAVSVAVGSEPASQLPSCLYPLAEGPVGPIVFSPGPRTSPVLVELPQFSPPSPTSTYSPGTLPSPSLSPPPPPPPSYPPPAPMLASCPIPAPGYRNHHQQPQSRAASRQSQVLVPPPAVLPTCPPPAPIPKPLVAPPLRATPSPSPIFNRAQQSYTGSVGGDCAPGTSTVPPPPLPPRWTPTSLLHTPEGCGGEGAGRRSVASPEIEILSPAESSSHLSWRGQEGSCGDRQKERLRHRWTGGDGDGGRRRGDDGGRRRGDDGGRRRGDGSGRRGAGDGRRRRDDDGGRCGDDDGGRRGDGDSGRRRHDDGGRRRHDDGGRRRGGDGGRRGDGDGARRRTPARRTSLPHRYDQQRPGSRRSRSPTRPARLRDHPTDHSTLYW